MAHHQENPETSLVLQIQCIKSDTHKMTSYQQMNPQVMFTQAPERLN